MKILHIVENYSPSVGGMQEVVKQLSERMAALGHQVTVACSTHPDRNSERINGVTIRSFNISGSLVQGIKGNQEVYEQFLLQQQNDIVVFFAAQIWSTDIALPLLDKISGKKVFVPTGFSSLHHPSYKSYYNQMSKWMHSFDMNVFLSDDYRDIQFAKAHGINRYTIIPNGADEREFLNVELGLFRKSFQIPETRILVLHVGSFTGLKGHLEALQLLNRIRHNNVTLCFIGNDYEHFPRYKRTKVKWWIERAKLFFSSKKLHILEPNRKRTLEAFADADIFLFPSNIECSPLVLFEAVASGTPFLSSKVGNTEEIAQWTGGGLIMPTYIDANGFSHIKIDESADMLDDLIENKNLRKQLSEVGRKNWREKFTWEKISEAYIAMYNQLNTQA
jgi:glycosyltransferase involved in cell wall biosynthesis